MFDHFQNMFGLRKTPKNCDPEITPKNQLFGKKIFLDFPANQFFFFTEIFLKKISGACPSRENVHVFEKT